MFNVHCDALQQRSLSSKKLDAEKKNRQKDTTEQAMKRSWEEVTLIGAAGKSSSQLLMSRPMYAVSLSPVPGFFMSYLCIVFLLFS